MERRNLKWQRRHLGERGKEWPNQGLGEKAKLPGMEEEVEDGLEIFALTTVGACWERTWVLSRGGRGLPADLDPW